MDRETQKTIITEYLRKAQNIVAKESTLQGIYLRANPDKENKGKQSTFLCFQDALGMQSVL